MSGLRNFILLIITLVLQPCVSHAVDHDNVVRIASGEKLGLYYAIAQEICSIIYNSADKQNCEVIQTHGSFENIELLNNNKVDFAIVQQDSLFNDDNRIANDDIVAVFKLYPEIFTFIVPKTSNIEFITDVSHKKIVAGKPNSGVRYVLKRLLDQLYVDDSDVVYEENVSTPAIPDALCNGTIDGVALMIAHPNAMVHEILKECKIKFLPISNNLVNTLIAQYPYYQKSFIDDNLYPGVVYPVLTISTNAMLVTNKSTNKNHITGLITKVIARFDDLRLAHKVLNELDYNFMFNGLKVPRHSAVEEALKILE